MKDKIFIFIVGLLVGAIITSLGFLIYEKTHKNTHQMPNMERMQMMERPDGDTPPEKPNGMENDDNRPELPTKNDSTAKETQTRKEN